MPDNCPFFRCIDQQKLEGYLGGEWPHWLAAGFQYKEQALEFAEISGTHSGENMADLLQKLLEELRLEDKLLAITADNASLMRRWSQKCIFIWPRNLAMQILLVVTEECCVFKGVMATSAAPCMYST
ncbi:hypothetical protein BDV29DRAFT_159793 [Aspergillus leporis]|uniref:DUF659 domain-containing protein n=1 Tax=Aspergillus leporis TaxID=41062 RepID=A0A5N5WTL6_9EURO|nr:hypothetical protein BDV29DRAFT_159793 [Aspergillus leporis]